MNDKTDTPDLSLPIDPRLLTEQGIHDLFVADGWIPPTWLPIADAPRDGTPVLVFDALEETQTTACWQPHENSGMWFLCSSDQFGEPMPCDPTHYKPLGPDPEQAA